MKPSVLPQPRSPRIGIAAQLRPIADLRLRQIVMLLVGVVFLSIKSYEGILALGAMELETGMSMFAFLVIAGLVLSGTLVALGIWISRCPSEQP